MAKNNEKPNPKGRAGGKRLTIAQKKELELIKQKNDANDETLKQFREMEESGIKLNKHQQKRLDLAQRESIIKNETTSLEKSLLKNAQSLNKIKSKSADLTKGALDSAKHHLKTGTLTEDQFKSQVAIMDQLKTGTASSEEVLQAMRDIGKGMTPEMQDYLNVQLEVARTQELQKGLTEGIDNLFGGVVTKAKNFAKQLKANPILAIFTVAVVLLKQFSDQLDKIGEQFGAIGVKDLAGPIMKADAEMAKLGYDAGTAATMAEQLSTGLMISLESAIELAPEVANMSKALGLSVEDGGKLVETFSKLGGLTSQQAIDMTKSTAALAKQEGVAPKAVLQDIAANGEAFAKFMKDGGDNIKNAAIQAKKLGTDLGTVAGIAEGLLDFQGSLEKEMEASVMLGKQLNFQKARELALTGDLEGMMKEVVGQLGDQNEWESLNVLEKKALADAVGVSVAQMGKLIDKEKEAATLAGKIADQESLDELIGENTISEMSQVVFQLKSIAASVMQGLGPALNSLLVPIAAVAGFLSSTIGLLDQYVGIIPVLVASLIAWKGAAMGVYIAEKKKAIQQAISTHGSVAGAVANYFKASSLASVGMPFGMAGWLALGVLAAGTIFKFMSKSKNAGDVISPADGKTQISTKEGELLNLSPNDDLLAGPGIAGAAGGGSPSIDLTPVVNAIGGLKEQVVSQQTQIEILKKNMGEYFGLNGTAVKGIGREVVGAIQSAK